MCIILELMIHMVRFYHFQNRRTSLFSNIVNILMHSFVRFITSELHLTHSFFFFLSLFDAFALNSAGIAESRAKCSFKVSTGEP